MYTLYHAPSKASVIVLWALIELKAKLGIEYKVSTVSFEDKAQKSPEYLKLNPKGQVPCLLVDEPSEQPPYAISETTAILLFLVDRHPEAELGPRGTGKERAVFLESMVYFANTLLPAFRNYTYASREVSESSAEGARELALIWIVSGCDFINEQLGSREFIAGDRLTVADYLGVVLMTWTRRQPRPAMQLGNIRRWVGRVMSEASWGTLCDVEGIPEERRKAFLSE